MSLKSKRRIVRERVLQILYAYELNHESLQVLIDETLSDIKDEADKQFAKDLVNKILIHVKKLDEKILERVANWEMNRIALIDRLLLRMGICELLYFPDIPHFLGNLPLCSCKHRLRSWAGFLRCISSGNY